MASRSRGAMARVRVGKVTVYPHHGSWWLYYRDGDKSIRRKVAASRMAAGSRDFAMVLRQLMPHFAIQPVQALDCPQVRPRAVVTFSTAAWVLPGVPAIEETITIDMFKTPQHILHLQRCMEAKKENPKAALRDIAGMIGVNYMTVKRAFDYAHRVEKAGTDGLYRVLSEAPVVASRWRKS